MSTNFQQDELDKLLQSVPSAPKGGPLPPRPATSPGQARVKGLEDFAKAHGFEVRSGYATGGHNRGSKHYAGHAVDVRTRDRRPEEVDSFIEKAKQSGFVVRDERVRPPGQRVWKGPHVHVEYDELGQLLADVPDAPQAQTSQPDSFSPLPNRQRAAAQTPAPEEDEVIRTEGAVDRLTGQPVLPTDPRRRVGLAEPALKAVDAEARLSGPATLAARAAQAALPKGRENLLESVEVFVPGTNPTRADINNAIAARLGQGWPELFDRFRQEMGVEPVQSDADLTPLDAYGGTNREGQFGFRYRAHPTTDLIEALKAFDQGGKEAYHAKLDELRGADKQALEEYEGRQGFVEDVKRGVLKTGQATAQLGENLRQIHEGEDPRLTDTNQQTIDESRAAMPDYTTNLGAVAGEGIEAVGGLARMTALPVNPQLAALLSTYVENLNRGDEEALKSAASIAPMLIVGIGAERVAALRNMSAAKRQAFVRSVQGATNVGQAVAGGETRPSRLVGQAVIGAGFPVGRANYDAAPTRGLRERIQGRIETDLRPSEPAVTPEMEAARSASSPARRSYQHRDFGLVTEAGSQAGVAKGGVRVVDGGGAEHVIRKPKGTGAGNQLAVPVRRQDADIEGSDALADARTGGVGAVADTDVARSTTGRAGGVASEPPAAVTRAGDRGVHVGTETAARPPLDRETLKTAFQEAYNLDEPRSEAVVSLVDARARAWAKEGPDRTPEQYIPARIAGVVKGGEVGTGALAQEAWHGSPHRFDRFSTEKIGTGEGAQSYGHGLYFTDKREIAQHYKEKLSTMPPARSLTDAMGEVKTGGRSATDFKVATYPELVEAAKKGDAAEALRFAEKQIKSWEQLAASPDYPYQSYAREQLTALKDFAASVKSDGIRYGDKRGSLYRVDLSPKEDDYLLWDRPLSEQSPKVKAALRKAGYDVPDRRPLSDRQVVDLGRRFLTSNRAQDLWREDIGIRDSMRPAVRAFEAGEAEFVKFARSLEGQKFFDRYIHKTGGKNLTGEMFYRELQFTDAGVPGRQDSIGQRGASERLRELGVRGIKYLAGDSRAAGEGSFNYVIFDDADVSIKEVLAQTNKAATEFLSDGRAILRGFQKADVSSAAHEFAHVFRRDLSPELLRDAEEAIGVKDGKWTKPDEEKFARGFERYLKTGVAPSTKLQRVFEAFKNWLTEIYGAVRGKNHPLGFKPNPQLVAVFDRALGGAPKGEFGQTIHHLYRSPDADTRPFFANDSVRAALGLKPVPSDSSSSDLSAAMKETATKLAESQGRPRTSHMHPEFLARWSRQNKVDDEGMRALRFATDEAAKKVEAKATEATTDAAAPAAAAPVDSLPDKVIEDLYAGRIRPRAFAGEAQRAGVSADEIRAIVRDAEAYRTQERNSAQGKAGGRAGAVPESGRGGRDGARADVESDVLYQSADEMRHPFKDAARKRGGEGERWAAAEIERQLRAADGHLRRAGKAPPSQYELRRVRVIDVKPSQTGEDYRNPSSESLASRLSDYRAGKVNLDDLRRDDYLPIVLDAELRIVDGNHRHAAAVINGERHILSLVPTETEGPGRVTNLRDHLDEAEASVRESRRAEDFRTPDVLYQSAPSQIAQRAREAAARARAAQEKAPKTSERIADSAQVNAPKLSERAEVPRETYSAFRSRRAEGPKLSEGTGRKEGPRITEAPKLGPRLSDAKKAGPRLSEGLGPKAGPKVSEMGPRFGPKMEEYRRPTFKEQVADIANAPRSLKSSIDLSASMRQGAMFTLTHPGRASRIFFGQQLRSLSNKGYENFVSGLKADPDVKLMQDSGLHLTSLAPDKIGNREEAFASKLAGRVPLVKRSEHAYVTFLDEARRQWFKQLKGQAEAAAKDAGSSVTPEQYEAIAKFVNRATGRGDLGRGAINDAAPFLNSIFFAPRYAVSRIQVFDPRMYWRLPQGARRMALRQAIQHYATVATTLLLLKYGLGAEVSDDPTSSDFGKAKFGNTRYDLWSGQQSYATVTARVLKGVGDYASGEDEEGLKKAFRAGMNFGRYKLAPVPAAVVNLGMGNRPDRKKPTVGGEALEMIMPIYLNDLVEAYKEEGGVGVAKNAPGFVGIGTQTYSEKPYTRPRRATYQRRVER